VRSALLDLEASDRFRSLLGVDFNDGRRSVRDLVVSGERARGLGVMSWASSKVSYHGQHGQCTNAPIRTLSSSLVAAGWLRSLRGVFGGSESMLDC
jgi:hypothetical protein